MEQRSRDAAHAPIDATRSNSNSLPSRLARPGLELSVINKLIYSQVPLNRLTSPRRLLLPRSSGSILPADVHSLSASPRPAPALFPFLSLSCFPAQSVGSISGASGSFLGGGTTSPVSLPSSTRCQPSAAPPGGVTVGLEEYGPRVLEMAMIWVRS